MTIAASLNESFRDALVAYYLGEVVPNDATLNSLGLTGKLKTENDLYEFLLLDTQVTQAVETSPVASAIASLQQYINGALLGMEPGYNDCRFNDKVVAEWRDQRAQYPLWAANQQLAWYPSLYIDPSLRMKKSSYFQQLENDINQNRINLDTTQEAVKAYLTSFEEVANLTIVNGYIDSTNFATGTYYFIGKSRAEGAYYWRSVDMNERSYLEGTSGPRKDNPQPGAWSDWKKANLPISNSAIEHTIRPVYFNKRLFVTWVEWVDNVAPDGSGDLEATPPDAGIYPHRQLPKPKATATLRLHLTYKKYDDSWSAPQCYIETQVDPDKVSVDGVPDVQTIAVVDTSTTPEAMLFALYGGYVASANADGSRDTYQLLKTLKLDKNFNAHPMFPLRGKVDGSTDPGKNRPLVLRSGHLFGHSNAGRFQFPMTGAVISIKSVNTTAPNSGSTGVYGWNHGGWQGRIAQNQADSSVIFNPANNKLTVTTHVSAAFESRSSTYLRIAATGTFNYVINLAVPADLTGEGFARLGAGSTFTTTSSQLKKNGEFGFNHLITSFLSDLLEGVPRVTLQASSGSATLEGKYVRKTALWWLLGLSQNGPVSSTLHIYAPGVSAELTNPVCQQIVEANRYQQFLARPSAMDTPTPVNINQKVNLKVDPVKQQHLAPASHSQTVTIDINPETLRPDWSTTWPERDSSFTVIEGVFVTQQRENSTTSLGHCAKATKIELQAIGDSDALRSPKISLHTSPTLGTAEFIDFKDSSIERSDETAGTRKPIRMNTLFARNLIDRASVALENLLSWETQMLPEPALEAGAAEPPMDFTGANGLYFWELFFHLPFMISHRLNTEQQFSEAEYWLSFIFDATRRSDGDRPDYWNVVPLEDRPAEGRERSTRAPIDPDGIASDNPVHYRKAVYNHYIKNLLDRGDAAYRQLTPDALNEAKLWYVRALDLLGPRPDKRLVSGWEPVTLQTLSDSINWKLRAFENRLNEQEKIIKESAQANNGQSLIIFQQPPLMLMRAGDDATIPELDSGYFRTAMNRELVQNWDTAEARLRNLRNNRTLDGKPLQLPLFASPLDPRALMSAYGSGAAGGGAGRLLGQEIPHYRFSVMHSRATNAVESLIQFGSTLLSLLERKDNAQLQEMQQQQAWDMAKQGITLQQLVQRVEDESRKALLANRAIAESRAAYYGKLADEVVNAGEVAAGALHLQARVMEGAAYVSQAIGEGLKVAPNEVGAVGGVIAGMSGGAIVGTSTGGWRLEGVPGIATAVSQGLATAYHGAAEALDRTEQYRRRHQEWMQAQEQAQREIEQIDAQLSVHDAQAKVTAEQLRQAQMLVDQAAITYQFLSKRFTNAQLYQWLNGQFATFYYQAYDTTLSLCLAAEACWQYEIADRKTRFIQPGAWKDSYRGLTAGESLKLNLMKMEAAYLQRNARQLEITKTVSVRRLLEEGGKSWADAVRDLGQNSGLEIKLEQSLFDRDYLGQYQRRIKRVSVTLPAVLGPYEDVAAVLTQTYSKVEMGETAGDDVWDNMRASQQIALSSGMDDDGMFTLNFDDDRYLPFEGTGAVSNWNLRFSRHTPELLASLNDVIVRVSYTAKSA